MPDSVLFDYLQLCCLVVMIREWGRHRLFNGKGDPGMNPG